MKLKDDLAELEARRVAYTSMTSDPRISDEERAEWAERLDEVQALQECFAADMKADPLGYLAWRWADDSAEVQRQLTRFRQ
jgi:hypothetical protein